MLLGNVIRSMASKRRKGRMSMHQFLTAAQSGALAGAFGIALGLFAAALVIIIVALVLIRRTNRRIREEEDRERRRHEP